MARKPEPKSKNMATKTIAWPKGGLVLNGAPSQEVAPPARVIKIGPELALKLLERNTLNRNIRQTAVETFAKDMKAGNWLLNGETLIFARDGQLLDGQHRLWAVVEAGVQVDFLVVEGVDPAVFYTIDSGKSRSFGDVATIGGEVNTNLLASTTKFIWWVEHGARGSARASKATHTELKEVLAKNSDVPERVKEVYETKKIRNTGSATALAYVYTMAHRLDPKRAIAWLSMLDTGLGQGDEQLSRGHPIYEMRERMAVNKASKRKMAAEEIAALFIKSWNSWILGKRTMAAMRWTKNEEFPVLVDPKAPAKKRTRKATL